MKLAQGGDPFGKIDPSPFIGGGSLSGNPVEGLAKMIGTLVNLFILVSGLFLLLYLMWGAFDWITSGGEKEKVAKAQSKITNALIGIVLVFVVLVVFGVLSGEILGIIKIDGTGNWIISVPTVQK